MTLFQDWQKRHEIDEAIPERVKVMFRRYGRAPEGTKCKDCKFLHGYLYHTATYYKCTKYGVSHGEATDWRLKYPACGRFEPSNPAIPLEEK